MAKTVYPDWVQKQKTKGTAVKKVGNNYYLYKHSSKRVPGKKNPVPSDTYIGKITPEGVVASSNRKVDANDTDIVVREYGFSYAMQRLCPASWREPLGNLWQEVLDYIIVRESPESYIPDRRRVAEKLDPHIQLGAQKASLLRRMKHESGVELKDIRCLSTIYLVTIGGKRFISKISGEQRSLMEKIGIVMEAD